MCKGALSKRAELRVVGVEGWHAPEGGLSIFCSSNSGRKAREGWSLFTFLAVLRTRLHHLNPFFPENVVESNLFLESRSE